MVDFTTYQPPGVYIEEEVAPTVSVVGATPTVIALVGPSVGYREFTEAVVLSGTTAKVLTQKGINTSTVVVRAADGTTYAPAGYSLTVAAGADGNISTTTDNTTSLARVGTVIPDGSTVYVTYRYTDTTYNQPTRLYDYDDIVDAYGPAIDLATNAIVSPLTLAAKVARENGARDLVLVSTGTGTVTRAELNAAYDKLESLFDVDLVVPITQGIAAGDAVGVGTDLKAYVEKSSNINGLFKVGVLGFDAAMITAPETIIGSFRSRRLVFVGTPQRVSFFNGQNNTSFDVGATYLAAAVAGVTAAQPTQVPLTKKVVRGFAGVPSSVSAAMTATSKNNQSDQGVLVVEVARSGAMVVRHGTTSDRTNVQTRELSLVRAKDSLVQLIQDTFDAAGLVGGFIDGETTVRVQGVVTGCLETATRSQLIVGYGGVKVRQRAGDPQVIEVKFQYQPAYPLNYIVVSFSINTVTGETTALDLAA